MNFSQSLHECFFPSTWVRSLAEIFQEKLCKWSFIRERRRRRAEKRLSKRVFLESPFLLCPLKVCFFKTPERSWKPYGGRGETDSPKTPFWATVSPHDAFAAPLACPHIILGGSSVGWFSFLWLLSHMFTRWAIQEVRIDAACADFPKCFLVSVSADALVPSSQPGHYMK